jgi:hypothetical protein
MRRVSGTALHAAVIACVAALACSKQSSQQVIAASSAPPRTIASSQASVTSATTTPVSTSLAQTKTPFATPAQTAPPLVAADQTAGPFHVGTQTFTFVKHIQKIDGSKSPDDSTVEWWELRDANGKAVYREQYGVSFENGTFTETEGVGARELKTKFGQGILVDGMSLPSAPNSGSWVQVFGLFNGKLVPFSGPIATEGEFLEEEVVSFQPSALSRGQQQQIVSRDVLNFRMWTGNFNITYAVAVDWTQGALHPAWTCMERTSKGPSSACRYKVQADPAPRTEMTFVRLFSEPDPGFTPKHVVIKPDSKIEYLEAQMPVSWNSNEKNTTFGVQVSDAPSPSDPIWLHIRVDGQEGWIFGEEDFEAVGLPTAG